MDLPLLEDAEPGKSLRPAPEERLVHLLADRVRAIRPEIALGEETGPAGACRVVCGRRKRGSKCSAIISAKDRPVYCIRAVGLT